MVVADASGTPTQSTGRLDATGVKCVLLDIEGTICPISFVKDTLFPYALHALPDVLATRWDDPDFKPYRDAFPEDRRSSPAALLAYAEQLTAQDRKDSCLKSLQGYLWETGYKTGAYATPLFPDVAPRLKEWRAAGRTLAIYSSGSVFAQKLLFGHVRVRPHPPGIQHELVTEDLQGLIADWFDTVNAGPKKETGSYGRIAEALGLKPADILFLTDSVEEYDAATGAGLKAGLMVRPENPPLSDSDAERVKTLSSLRDVIV